MAELLAWYFVVVVVIVEEAQNVLIWCSGSSPSAGRDVPQNAEFHMSLADADADAIFHDHLRITIHNCMFSDWEEARGELK
jgi:hypothetical protein